MSINFTRGNGVWHAAGYNSLLQPSEMCESLNNVNSTSNMLFVSCLNWGSSRNFGAALYNVCPAAPSAKNNGTLQSYTAMNGGPTYSQFLPFSQTFGYDNTNRLTWANDTGGWSRTFGYDPYGNMWVPGNSGVILAGNTPTSQGQFTSNNQIAGNAYDAAGNLLSVNGNTAIYDAENRLVQVTEAPAYGGATESVAYDGSGQRVEKLVPSAMSVYVYDAFGALAAQYSSSANTAQCTTCYLSTDHLGSVRLVTDQGGSVIARHDYLPFGEEIPANTAQRNSEWGSTADVAGKFTGQMRDSETGLDFFNARYFGAALGRFTSPDPANAGADPADPQTWNGYGYVRGNPMALTDPTGMGSDPCENNTSCLAGIPGCLNNVKLCQQTQFGFDPFVTDAFRFLNSGITDEENGTLNFGSFASSAPLFSATGYGKADVLTSSTPRRSGNPTATQPCFNTAAFASTLDKNACPASKGQCARYVRLALVGGGINSTGRPNAAGDYGPFLRSKGFLPVSVQGYTPQVGDIAVFGKTDVHPFGHVTGFDGVKWVSDFKQNHMNPYKAPATAGPLTLYRDPNPCGGGA